MSSAAAPTSQAPVTTPATTAEASSAPAPATSSPTPTPTSQVAQTTTPQSTAAPSSSSTPAANSPSSTPSSAAASSPAGATSSSPTPAKTSSSSSASKVSLTSSLSFVVQTSDGQVFTQTSVVTLPASTPTDSGSQSNTRSAPTSFFHNTGAVAGVFSVVGIIALVLIFVLLTSFVRRRRARKFDREIDEAAAVAAAAQAPDFDDFDYTSGTGIYAQYSETSHGTYNQPPLSHERSRNNLGDIPASLDTHNSTGGPAGAAGIGARGRSLRSGMQDPFGALSNPPEQYEMTESRRSWHQGSLRGGGGTEVTTYDMLQAAELSGSDPYAVTRAPSTRLANLPMQSGVSGLMRSQSQGTSMLPTTAENYPMPTAAPAYPGGQDRPYPPEKARYSGLYTPAGDADVYSGHPDRQSVLLDNPHSPGLPPPRAQDEHEDVAEQYEPSPFPHGREEPARASLADDEDYGYNIGNRVLRVANE